MPPVQAYKEVIHDGHRNRNVTFREVYYYSIPSDLSEEIDEMSTFEEAKAVSLTQLVLKLEFGHSRFDGDLNPNNQAFTRFTIFDLDENPLRSIISGEWELDFNITREHQIVNAQYYIEKNGTRVAFEDIRCSLEGFMIAFKKFEQLSSLPFSLSKGVIDTSKLKAEIMRLQKENLQLKELINQIHTITAF